MVPASTPFNVDNPVEETDEIIYDLSYKIYSRNIQEDLDDGVIDPTEPLLERVLQPPRPKSPTPVEEPMEDVRDVTPPFVELDRSSPPFSPPHRRSETYDPEADPLALDEDEVRFLYSFH